METYVKEVKRTLYFDGEPVEVKCRCRFDKDSDKEVEDLGLYNVMIEEANELYRLRHNLLAAEQISDFRYQTGLTIKQLSTITSIDVCRLEYFEVGEFPTHEENLVLKAIIKHPELIEAYLNETKSVSSRKQ